MFTLYLHNFWMLVKGIVQPKIKMYAPLSQTSSGSKQACGSFYLLNTKKMENSQPFLYNKRKKIGLKQVEVNKWWHNINFCVNYPFKYHSHWFPKGWKQYWKFSSVQYDAKCEKRKRQRPILQNISLYVKSTGSKSYRITGLTDTMT